MAKSDFAWQETQQIGVIDISEKKRLLVQFNSLEPLEGEEDDRWFVSVTTMQKFKKKGETDVLWHVTKNATFPMDVWFEIVELIESNTEE